MIVHKHGLCHVLLSWRACHHGGHAQVRRVGHRGGGPDYPREDDPEKDLEFEEVKWPFIIFETKKRYLARIWEHADQEKGKLYYKGVEKTRRTTRSSSATCTRRS